MMNTIVCSRSMLLREIGKKGRRAVSLALILATVAVAESLSAGVARFHRLR